MQQVVPLSYSQMVSIHFNGQLTHIYQTEYVTVEIPGMNRGGRYAAIPQWESIFETRKMIRFLYDYKLCTTAG